MSFISAGTDRVGAGLPGRPPSGVPGRDNGGVGRTAVRGGVGASRVAVAGFGALERGGGGAAGAILRVLGRGGRPTTSSSSLTSVLSSSDWHTQQCSLYTRPCYGMHALGLDRRSKLANFKFGRICSLAAKGEIRSTTTTLRKSLLSLSLSFSLQPMVNASTAQDAHALSLQNRRPLSRISPALPLSSSPPAPLRFLQP
ncbi:hypothetical protein BJY59DRAFT_97431 [Rhodotorula toruloides]